MRPATTLLPRVALVAMLLTACTTTTTAPGGSDGPGGSGDPTPSPVRTTPLECETAGYPCSPADVAPGTLARSDELAGAAATSITDGDSVADTAAWLEGQQNVVEVEHDDSTIRFRLEGGRPTWVLPPRTDAAPTAKATPPRGIPLPAALSANDRALSAPGFRPLAS